jgi:hypothetical protein
MAGEGYRHSLRRGWPHARNLSATRIRRDRRVESPPTKNAPGDETFFLRSLDIFAKGHAGSFLGRYNHAERIGTADCRFRESGNSTKRSAHCPPSTHR